MVTVTPPNGNLKRIPQERGRSGLRDLRHSHWPFVLLSSWTAGMLIRYYIGRSFAISHRLIHVTNVWCHNYKSQRSLEDYRIFIPTTCCLAHTTQSTRYIVVVRSEGISVSMAGKTLGERKKSVVTFLTGRWEVEGGNSSTFVTVWIPQQPSAAAMLFFDDRIPLSK